MRRSTVAGLFFAICLLLQPATSQAADWPDTPLARVEALALIQTLNANLLSHPSATLTIEDWCARHNLAKDAKIVARRVPVADKQLTDQQRAELGISRKETVRYRSVQLVCGTHVLSVAENWYVPSRLTPEMNHVLETTNTPFGKAVAALHFTRRTLDATLLWSPLPVDWDMQKLPPATETLLTIPDHLLQHRAVLSRADGTPFCEVVETYTAAILDFPPPS